MKNRFLVFSVILASTVFASVLLYSKFYIPNSSFAFTGPSQSGGSGSGAIGVNSANNLSVGTSTPASDTKLFIVASSTGSSNYPIRIVQPDSSPLFLVRDDGIIGIKVSSATSTLTVAGEVKSTTGGFVFPDGTSQTTAAGSSQVPAQNVTAGVFGAGNFAFPSSLGIATSSQVGLPAALTVYATSSFLGNVGIGTTGPGTKLHVFGTNPELRVEADAVGGDSFLWLKQVNRTDLGLKLWADNSEGTTYIDSLWDNNAGNLYIRTKASATPVNAITILGSGNVGIGTTGPNYKLDVNGQIGVNSDLVLQVGGVATGYIFGAGSNLYIRSLNAQDIIFQDAATTNVTFKGDTGNVGIGTTTPAYKLDVVGQVRSTSGGYVFPDGTSQTTAATGGGGGWSTASGYVYLATSTDNVGLGVSNPQYQLILAGKGVATVFGVDNTNVFAAKNAAGSYEQYLWPRWSDNIMYTNYGSGGWNIRNNSSTVTMFMTHDGNVGVGGMTSVGRKLETTEINIRASTGSGGRATFLNSDSIWVNSSYDPAAPTSGWSRSMFFATSSNIGIGTTTPQTTLAVNGTFQLGNYAATSSVSCTSAVVGAMIYAQNAGKPYVCNGSVWNAIDYTLADCTADNGGNCSIRVASKNLVDADLAAANIKYGVNIFGFTGSYPGSTTANAAAAQVLSGYSCYTGAPASLSLINGSMTNVGAQVITPSTVNQTITAGYHDGSGYCAGDADLVASNIFTGVQIFGALGTVQPTWHAAIAGQSGDTVCASYGGTVNNYVSGCICYDAGGGGLIGQDCTTTSNSCTTNTSDQWLCKK